MYASEYADVISTAASIIGILASSIAIFLGIRSIRRKRANSWIDLGAVVFTLVSLIVPICGYHYAAQLSKTAISKPIIELMPGEQISGLLAQHDEMHFSIDVPKDIDHLSIRLEGSPEADFDVKVCEANQFYKGSLYNVIHEPKNITYYVTIMPRHASSDFKLIAEWDTAFASIDSGLR